MLGKAGLEHEGHGVIKFVRAKAGVGRALKRFLVGAVRQHAVVQGYATGDKAFGFGIIDAVNISHQFGHDILVIPRRAKGIFRHGPAFTEQHEVDICGAFDAGRGGEDGENRRVRVIKQNSPNRAIGGEIVFHRAIVAVPGDHIQRAVADVGFVKLATPFDGDGGRNLAVFKGGDGGFEITPVGQAVGTDGAARGQFKLLAVVFTDKTTGGACDQFDPVDQPARDDRDFLRGEVNDAEFGAKAQAPFLRDDQQFAIGAEEVAVCHGLRDKINM